MNRLLTLIITVVFFIPSCAMDRPHFIELNKKASELAKEKNWKGLREALIEIGREMPAPTPVYLLRMASVEARLGNNAEAIRWMEKYAAMGLRYDVAQDDDLKPPLADTAFAPVAQEMKERTKPVQKTEAVCLLPLPDLMPEDLTFDKASATFVLSGIRHHTLYRATMPKDGAAECTLQEIPLEEQAKRWPVLAVSADATRKLIWMTANAMPDFSGFPKKMKARPRSSPSMPPAAERCDASISPAADRRFWVICQ